MAKRKTIGENPLDAVVPVLTAEPGRDGAGNKRASKREPKPREGKRVIKERLTIHLPVELIDRIKNAVYWTPGLTLAELGERAFTEILRKMERERGEPFPPRRSELKGGRPLK